MGQPLWTRNWTSAYIAAENDDTFWIVTQDGVFQKFNVATGSEDWSVPNPLNGQPFGYMPNDEFVVLEEGRGPGVWVYDAATGKQLWGRTRCSALCLLGAD